MVESERFHALTPEEMTEEQRIVFSEIIEGPRGAIQGPFKALIRSPELTRRVQKLGAYVRFENVLPDRLKEFAILLTARKWTAQYEWYSHHRLAMQAKLDPALAEAVRHGKRPDVMQADESVVYDFCIQLLNRGSVPDAVYSAALGMFGERGVIDLVGTVGYYSLVSMVLNVDRVPIPIGETPLAPLGA